MKKLMTICTPTYNRGHLLVNLYETLIIQSRQNFIWMIVDDGSSDNTEEVVNKFIKEAPFEILYYKKENGGKHTALNLGIEKANTELFFIVDSDDIVLKDATELIERYWNTVDKKDEYIGVAGLRGYSEDKIIGTCGDEEYIDATSIDYRYDLKYEGDRAEVFRTEILKENLFPVFKEEKFLTEAVVWNRIASKGFKFRWFRKIIVLTEYLDGGLTDNYEKLMINNFNGTKLYYKEFIHNKKINKKFRIHTLYIYLKLAKEKNCMGECLNELTNSRMKRVIYKVIYRLKEIREKK